MDGKSDIEIQHAKNVVLLKFIAIRNTMLNECCTPGTEAIDEKIGDALDLLDSARDAVNFALENHSIHSPPPEKALPK